MSQLVAHVSLLVGLVFLAACASMVPPDRLTEYVGQQALSDSLPAQVLLEGPTRTGLVVIADTTAPDAAPVLPDEALHRLATTLQQRLSESLPIAIEKVIPADGILPRVDPAQFSELGKKHGVAYLAVVVASSTEQEYPLTVFLGWHSHSQPGLRRDNWSLLEIVLLDVNSGRGVLHAEGRGWATLDRPTAPGINQWYPVIWLRPSDPNWRWWPPTYAGAPNTLRVIAMNEAARRLVLNLQEVWIQKRQVEVTSVPR